MALKKYSELSIPHLQWRIQDLNVGGDSFLKLDGKMIWEKDKLAK